MKRQSTRTILETYSNCANDELYFEKISKSMIKGYTKNLKETDKAMTCPECGFIVPKYKGRYPSKCPDCGKNFKEMFDTKNEKEIATAFKVGDNINCKHDNKTYEASIVSQCMESGKFTVMLKNSNEMTGKLLREVDVNSLSILAKESCEVVETLEAINEAKVPTGKKEYKNLKIRNEKNEYWPVITMTSKYSDYPVIQFAYTHDSWEKGASSMTPAWSLSSIIWSKITDTLYIDMGQNWKITGLKPVIAKLRKIYPKDTINEPEDIDFSKINKKLKKK
jgi:hypothetical protein